MRIQIEIAPGELIDRMTILQVKKERIDDPEKLRHVENELDTLSASLMRMRAWMEGNRITDKLSLLDQHTQEIKTANEKIWDVLQRQRDLENAGDLGEEFIKVSLEVYHVNDRRALAKRKINELLDTDIAEVKEYK